MVAILNSHSCQDRLAHASNECSLFKIDRFPPLRSTIYYLRNIVFLFQGYNANCERIFTLINAHWSDERKNIKLDTVKNIVTVKFKFKEFTCSQFHSYLEKKELLRMNRNEAEYKKVNTLSARNKGSPVSSLKNVSILIGYNFSPERRTAI